MFTAKNIELGEVVEARKEKISGEDAWHILSSVDEIVVGRGKKYESFVPSSDNKEAIMRVCLGRTGNLRAPALKIGSRMVIGFNEEMYNAFVR